MEADFEICPYCKQSIHWKHLFSHACPARSHEDKKRNVQHHNNFKRNGTPDLMMQGLPGVKHIKKCEYEELGCVFQTSNNNSLKLHTSQCPYGKIGPLVNSLRQEINFSQQVLHNIHKSACRSDAKLQDLKKENEYISRTVERLEEFSNLVIQARDSENKLIESLFSTIIENNNSNTLNIENIHTLKIRYEKMRANHQLKINQFPTLQCLNTLEVENHSNSDPTN